LLEYAILSILIIQAIKGEKGEGREKLNDNYIHFESGAVTGALGAVALGIITFRYFTWYDILLHVLGGLLELNIFRGFDRE